MKSYSLLFITIFAFACKSSIKQQEDSIYSRHLQRHIPLTIIATAMPSKKEEMNLLLFIDNNLLEEIRAKKIIDSLYKKKLIEPMMLVSFEGKEGDFGMEEAKMDQAKQYKKFNAFVSDELYPFVKKKAVIRKFNSVGIVGFLKGAVSSFDIAFNHDEKIQMVGMFSPQFNLGNESDGELLFHILESSRKKPSLKLWIEDGGLDSNVIKFDQIISNKIKTIDGTFIPQEKADGALKKKPNIRNFAAFLLWAFPKKA